MMPGQWRLTGRSCAGDSEVVLPLSVSPLNPRLAFLGVIICLIACAPPLAEDATQRRQGLLGGIKDGGDPVLVSCALDHEEPAHLRQSVIGGTEDDGDSSVVLVVAQTLAGEQLLCTGTVIGERSVLTAAHCLVPQVVGKDATFWLFLGPDFLAPGARSRPELLRTVERVDFDPEFEADLLQRGHDIGVVVAKEPLGIAPLAVSREALPSGVQAVRIVGYGVARALDTAADTAGRRRQVQVPVLGIGRGSVEVGIAERGPCLGDSGGPALLPPEGETTEYVVGVVSYSPRACDGGAVVTATAAYLPLIDGWLATESIAQGWGGCTVAQPGNTRGPAHPLWPGLLLAGGLLTRRRRGERPARVSRH